MVAEKYILETFWAYLAGIIDGEGSIKHYESFHFHNTDNKSYLHKTYVCTISNTDLKMLQYIQTTTEAGRIHPMHLKTETTKDAYALAFSQKEQAIILPRIIPYLFIKKIDAEINLQYVKDYHKRGVKILKNVTTSLLQV